MNLRVECLYINKKASVILESVQHVKKSGDYQNKITVSIDDNRVTVFTKRVIISDEKFNVDNYIEIKDGSKYELSGVVLHKLKTNEKNIGAVGSLKINRAGKTEDIRWVHSHTITHQLITFLTSNNFNLIY